MFQAINTTMIKLFLGRASKVQQGMFNIFQAFIYYFLMNWLTCVSSGAFQFIMYGASPFKEPGVDHLEGAGSFHVLCSPHMWFSAVTSGTVFWDGENQHLTTEKQKETLKRHTRCWALLMAHATGFAAFNAGGDFQHALDPNNPPLAYSVVVVAFVVMIAIFWSARTVRLKFLEQAAMRVKLPEPMTRSQRSSGK